MYDLVDSEDRDEFEKFCLEENYLWIEGYTASSALKDSTIT